MNRAKTSSVTELVKIIAREEAQKVVDEAIEAKRKRSRQKPKPRSISRSGLFWEVYEDKTLEENFTEFLEVVAGYHQRTPAAILARLEKGIKIGMY